MDSLDETLQQVLTFRNERDWEQFHTPKNLAAALTVEVSELQEAMLWKSDSEIREFVASASGRSEITSEIADVFIFALLLCHATGVDPIQAVRDKLKENAIKYPVKLTRGKATKYSRLGGEQGH